MAERKLACVIAAGGTAGHVDPALAVGEALRRRGVSVSFAGSPDRAEARLVPEAGFEFDPFNVLGFPRKPGPALLRAVGRAAVAPSACLKILERRKPDVVLGGGGFVAGPMIVAARVKHVPAALMEADAHLGLANRLAAPFARRVFLSYPLDGRTGPKYRVTGRPVRHVVDVDAGEARRGFGLPAQGPVLLVFGGSQGSLALNELAVESFGSSGPAVLHLCGERYERDLRARVSRTEYVLLPWTDDIGGALAAADVVLARAGGSVWEIAAAGKPAVLVPSPNVTADHQTKNAAYFAQGGGAIVVSERDILAVPDLVKSLLADESRRAQMGAAMRRLARPDAAGDIADALIALARGHA
jgi:UDP-N-acetylglucosamine--N-acetylmuramyl-(pentapeptide) pyrophosphoryl-undecaprenol N-acetylglucosamine transferase